jgi:hypothetical protein
MLSLHTDAVAQARQAKRVLRDHSLAQRFWAQTVPWISRVSW